MRPPEGIKTSVRESQRLFVIMAEKTVHDATVVPVSVDTSSEDAEPQGFDAAGTKKLLRKLDWHLIPFMSLIYL